MPRIIRALLIIILLTLLTSGPAAVSGVSAQPSAGGVQVFLVPRADPASPDTLLLIDLLTGTETRADIDGAGYTPADDALLFFDRPTRTARLLLRDGTTRLHPFITIPENARRVDWVVSPLWTAWTVTTGTNDALLTETTIAASDGSDAPRVLLTDGPRAGIRAFPVALSDDGTALFMDYQPDAIGDITPLRQYAGLFAVNTRDGAAALLPGEPGCFCGAGFGAGWFVRLTLGAGGGFGVRAFFLGPGGVSDAVERAIVGVDGGGATQGGAVAVDARGRRAAYALVTLGGLTGGADSTRLVVVDLENGTQRVRAAVPGVLRPVFWPDDDTVLLIDAADGVTWRWRPDQDELTLSARGVFIGVLGYN